MATWQMSDFYGKPYKQEPVPLDARGLNPLVQQRMGQQMYDRIEAYRRESEALEEAPLGSDLPPDPPPDIVDAAGNPLPWSE